MQIHEVIRNRRRTLGLTQEQMAHCLGVTAPAVNKWEKGITYPDITLLPSLARLLKTDLNTLLCFQENLTKDDMAVILNEIVETAKKEKTDGVKQAFLQIQKKVMEYPAHAELLYQLATVLRGLLLMFPCENDVRAKCDSYIRELYGRVAEGDDLSYANRARYALASESIQKGEYQEAEALIAMLPDYDPLDKRGLLILLYMQQKKSQEASELLEKKLNASIQEVFLMLDQLATAAVWENDMERAWELASYAGRLMEIYQWEYSSCTVAMSVAIEAQDADKCLALLEKMLASLSGPCQMADSVLYAHSKKTGSGIESGAALLRVLLDSLRQDEKFAFLWERKEFRELIQQYANPPVKSS